MVGIEKNEGEDTEGLVREILNEMGVLRESIEFHAVHRVGQKRVSTNSESSANGNGPSRSYNRQIIMRFVNRQHRELVWRNKENISKSKKYSGAFLVPDYPKEIAQGRSLLRKAARRARDNVNEIKAEIRNNRLYLVNSQTSYSLKELPEFLKE